MPKAVLYMDESSVLCSSSCLYLILSSSLKAYSKAGEWVLFIELRGLSFSFGLAPFRLVSAPA